MQVETKVKNKGQARLFESEYLEILTKTHPLIIWGMYLPLIVWSLFYANSHYGYSWQTVMMVFVGAIFFWSFAEYVLHRFVFHWVSENKAVQRFTYLLHGNHHEFPRDRQRLFMPPVPSLIPGLRYCSRCTIFSCVRQRLCSSRALSWGTSSMGRCTTPSTPGILLLNG
ncbi:hypothetical protein MKQ70_25945 [Chitinophaga sedimenti]|uniref:hypothetical protein n=1 Tax=Chitinophaga sedimenti TaxID=2033606 RepID=UPI00200591E1|nr:hypothetical protein [Chitinophaga sedimenti]MCK7558257.1 hypothetical protein [Chitinophaga sedimenti]